MSAKRKRVTEPKNDDHDEGSGVERPPDPEDAPVSKQAKKSDGAANDAKRREGKKTVDLEMQRDDDGTPFWELSRMRRVQLTEWRGSHLVNIREYYEDKSDGKLKPGKKGIALSIDQIAAFVEVLPAIEKELGSKGVTIPRPKYDGGDGELADTDAAGELQDKPRAEADSEVSTKRNFEATSDEEDQES